MKSDPANPFALPAGFVDSNRRKANENKQSSNFRPAPLGHSPLGVSPTRRAGLGLGPEQSHSSRESTIPANPDGTILPPPGHASNLTFQSSSEYHSPHHLRIELDYTLPYANPNSNNQRYNPNPPSTNIERDSTGPMVVSTSNQTSRLHTRWPEVAPTSQNSGQGSTRRKLKHTGHDHDRDHGGTRLHRQGSGEGQGIGHLPSNWHEHEYGYGHGDGGYAYDDRDRHHWHPSSQPQAQAQSSSQAQSQAYTNTGPHAALLVSSLATSPPTHLPGEQHRQSQSGRGGEEAELGTQVMGQRATASNHGQEESRTARTNDLRADIGLGSIHIDQEVVERVRERDQARDSDPGGQRVVSISDTEEGEAREKTPPKKRQRPVKVGRPAASQEAFIASNTPSYGNGSDRNARDGKKGKGKKQGGGGGGAGNETPYLPGRNGMVSKVKPKSVKSFSTATEARASKFFPRSQSEIAPYTQSGRSSKRPERFGDVTFNKRGGGMQAREAPASSSRIASGSRLAQTTATKDEEEEEIEDDEEVESPESEVVLVHSPIEAQSRSNPGKRKRLLPPSSPNPPGQTDIRSWGTEGSEASASLRQPNAISDDHPVASLASKPNGHGVLRAGDQRGGRGQPRASGPGSGNRGQLYETRTRRGSAHANGSTGDKEDGRKRERARSDDRAEGSRSRHISVESSDHRTGSRSPLGNVPTSDVDELEGKRPFVKKESQSTYPPRATRANTIGEENHPPKAASSRARSDDSDTNGRRQEASPTKKQENVSENPVKPKAPVSASTSSKTLEIYDSDEEDPAKYDMVHPTKRTSLRAGNQSAGSSKCASVTEDTSRPSRMPQAPVKAKPALAAEDRSRPRLPSPPEEQEVPEGLQEWLLQSNNARPQPKQAARASNVSAPAKQNGMTAAATRDTRTPNGNKQIVEDEFDPITTFPRHDHQVVDLEADESGAETDGQDNKGTGAVVPPVRSRSMSVSEENHAGAPGSKGPALDGVKSKKRKRSSTDAVDAEDDDSEVMVAPPDDVVRYTKTRGKRSQTMETKDGNIPVASVSKAAATQSRAKAMAARHLSVKIFQVDGIDVLQHGAEWSLDRNERDVLRFRCRGGASFNIQLRTEDVCYCGNLYQMMYVGFTKRIKTDMQPHLRLDLEGDRTSDHVYLIAVAVPRKADADQLRDDLRKNSNLTPLLYSAASSLVNEIVTILGKSVDSSVSMRVTEKRKHLTRAALATKHNVEQQSMSPEPDVSPRERHVPLQSFKPPKPADPDKLICQWPPTGRVEVNITAADVYRLEDYEYLNDTLIEFGLRHIAANEDQTSIASDKVHVFNSFFYKKISDRSRSVKVGDARTPAKAGRWEAYESVKKWTAKVDIFQKDFIVVPINENMHWYSAIICNPGAILARASVKEAVSHPAADGEGDGAPESDDESPADGNLPPNQDGVDVEKDELGGNYNKGDDEASSDGLMREKDISDGNVEADDQEGDPLALPSRRKSQRADTTRSRSASVAMEGGASRAVPIGQPPPDQASFFKLEEARPKPRPRRGPGAPGDSTPSADTPNTDAPPKRPTKMLPGSCVIITLDSMGGAHRPVASCLNRWLAYEAQKHHLQIIFDATEPAYHKSPSSPKQLNFTDCGVYLLHHVRQMLHRDGKLIQKYREIWESGVATTAAQKLLLNEIWDDEGAKNGRQYWQEIIRGLQASQEKKAVAEAPAGTQEMTGSLEVIATPAAPAAQAEHEIATEEPISPSAQVPAADDNGSADEQAAEDCLLSEPRSADSAPREEEAVPPLTTPASPAENSARFVRLFGSTGEHTADDPTTLQGEPAQQAQVPRAGRQLGIPLTSADETTDPLLSAVTFDIPPAASAIGDSVTVGASHDYPMDLMAETDSELNLTTMPSIAAAAGDLMHRLGKPAFDIPAPGTMRSDLDQVDGTDDEDLVGHEDDPDIASDPAASRDGDVEMTTTMPDDSPTCSAGHPGSQSGLLNGFEVIAAEVVITTPQADRDVIMTNPDHTEPEDVNMNASQRDSAPSSAEGQSRLHLLESGADTRNHSRALQSGRPAKSAGSGVPAKTERRQRVIDTVRDRSETAPSSPAGESLDPATSSRRPRLTQVCDMHMGQAMGHLLPLAQEEQEYGRDLMIEDIEPRQEPEPDHRSSNRSGTKSRREGGQSGNSIPHMMNPCPRQSNYVVIDVDSIARGVERERGG